MATSSAWRFSARGQPRDVLHLESFPIPTLPPTISIPKLYQRQPWLLVKVSHAALNPGGSYFISVFPAFTHVTPSIPEVEFCGEVVDTWTPPETEVAVSHVRKGDRVAGMIPTALSAAGIGALATHVAIPADLAVKVPENVAARDAAGLMLCGMTALRMVRDAEMQPGHRVLVNGASGGVGTMAVQVARNIVGEAGTIVAVCSGKNSQMVKKIGANEIVDYTQCNSIAAELSTRFAGRPFDCVLDCIGVQELFGASAALLQPGKPYVATIVKPQEMTLPSFAYAVLQLARNTLWPAARWLGGTGRKWKTVYMMDATREEREELVRLVADGKLTVIVDSVWSFEDAFKAYDVLWSGRARGKIIVRLNDE